MKPFCATMNMYGGEVLDLRSIVQSYEITSILGYIRRSRQDAEREKRTGEDTLTEQKELMESVLTAIQVPFTLKMEIGSGESIEGRPVFQDCLRDLENGAFQAIAVKEITRLSRGSYSDAGRIVNLLQSQRLMIITPYKVYDPRNPADMRQIRFELFMAREEFEMTRERMTGAKYTYAAQGKWISGMAPYGYTLNKKQSKLEAADENAKVVRLIFNLFLTGLNGKDYSYTAISSHLTALKIPSPSGKKKWNPSTVKAILQNEAYIGTVKYKVREKTKDGKRLIRPESEQISVPDAHAPIIDKEQFDQVQKKIRHKIPLLPARSDFQLNALAGVCTCAECGAPLSKYEARRKRRNKDGTTSVYHVKLLRCRNTCMNVRYDDVEDAILDYLMSLDALNKKELFTQIESMITAYESRNSIKAEEQMKEQLKRREKELHNKLHFIFDKYENGIYSDEMFLQRKSALDEEMNGLEQVKKEMNHSSGRKSEIDTACFSSLIPHAAHIYDTAESREEKNKLLRIIFQKVIVKMTARRKGPIPAQFEILPVLRYPFLTGNSSPSG